MEPLARCIRPCAASAFGNPSCRSLCSLPSAAQYVSRLRYAPPTVWIREQHARKSFNRASGHHRDLRLDRRRPDRDRVVYRNHQSTSHCIRFLCFFRGGRLGHARALTGTYGLSNRLHLLIALFVYFQLRNASRGRIRFTLRADHYRRTMGICRRMRAGARSSNCWVAPRRNDSRELIVPGAITASHTSSTIRLRTQTQWPAYGPFEHVFVENEWYDGPRAGIANVNGLPHRFLSQFDEGDDEYLGMFLLWPVDADELALEQEQWQIYVTWNERYEAGAADIDSHPVARARTDDGMNWLRYSNREGSQSLSMQDVRKRTLFARKKERIATKAPVRTISCRGCCCNT